jgi:dihydroorotase-like cyclic amidohydrolase
VWASGEASPTFHFWHFKEENTCLIICLPCPCLQAKAKVNVGHFLIIQFNIICCFLFYLCLQAKAKVNVGFWGGITPDNAHNETVLWGMLKAGALGFKSFVAPSGINDFPNVSRSDVAGAMHFLLSKGAPFFVHTELVTEVEQTEVSSAL